jgi:hypothetical protein
VQDESSGELRNLKVDRFKQQVVEICEVIAKEKERFMSNRVSEFPILITENRGYKVSTKKR